MDENNGLDVDQENASLDEDMSEDQAPDAAVLDEPAADSISSEENAIAGDTPDEVSAEVSQDEQAALLNQEDMVDESDDDVDVNSGGSGLLSQEEIDNAIEQGKSEDSEDDQDAGDDDGMSQEEIDAAINAAVGELDVGNFTSSEQQPMVKKADFQQLSSSNTSGGQRNIDLLMDVELPVSIELGRTTMDISDILALGPGSVVELEKLVGEPVDLLVNNKCVARGEVVVVEENFGLRITSLISPEERIKNLQ